MSATNHTHKDRTGGRPTVSVIIPTYNTATFIVETLESVFAQTYRDFEVIVVNDGSPDTDVLEELLAPYRERILYFTHENRGLAGARNTGIRSARGIYLAFLDSDDCWLPSYLACQMKLFEEAPAIDVVYSDAQHFGDPALTGKTYMQTYPSNGPVTLEALIKEECQVITSCTVARTQTVVNAGLFDETFRRCEDYDLWLRVLYRGGRMTYQKKVLGRYRSHPNSLSKNAMQMAEARIAVYEKAESTMDLSEKAHEILRRRLRQAQASFDLEAGRNFLSAGEFDRAKESLIKANNFFNRLKIKAAILGLQFAPHWTRSAVVTWQRLLLDRG